MPMQTAFENKLKKAIANDNVSCSSFSVVRKAQHMFEISHIWVLLSLSKREKQFIVK